MNQVTETVEGAGGERKDTWIFYSWFNTSPYLEEVI